MPGTIVRTVVLGLAAVVLALIAGWGSERGEAKSGVSGSEGMPTFSGRDLASFLKHPPRAMGKLRLEG